jgi:hypothetical protein
MSRCFEAITAEELKEKIFKINPYEADYWVSWRNLTPTVDKDLSKVSFDAENITDVEGAYKFGPEELIGFQTLPNGMSFLGMAAGGDWEIPVFFIIYWDGKKFRGYIPEKGNLWNTITKKAYGNDDEVDLKNCCKRWPDDFKEDMEPHDAMDGVDHYDIDAIKKDIMERIVKKDDKPLTKPKKDSKIREGAALLTYTDEELLAEIARRMKGK